jgi:DNA-binding NarL/FixJ family response regulator
MNRFRTKILIADDHTLVAEACGCLLESEFEVVGIVSDGRSAIQAAAELQPDVVVLDIAMPQLNGLDAGEQIKQRCRAIKLVYLTMNTAADVAAEAFRRGASGYVLKHCSADELILAIRRVMKNESYLSPMITKDTVEFLLRSGATYRDEKPISRRQAEVLRLFAEGKSMKEMADILQIKIGTIAFHKYQIMDLLGVKTSAELLQYGLRRHSGFSQRVE